VGRQQGGQAAGYPQTAPAVEDDDEYGHLKVADD
jgi:hypothetical protein